MTLPLFLCCVQGGEPHFVEREAEFAAAMKAVMMPGNEQAAVSKPIQTIGGCKSLAVQSLALPSPCPASKERRQQSGWLVRCTARADNQACPPCPSASDAACAVQAS